MIHRLILAFSTGFIVCASLTSLLAAEKKSPEARLQQLLKRYPDADANKDGKLSEDEARQYATKLRGKAPPTDSALPAADLRDVKYGPHARNVLDFWFAKNTNAAAPLIVFIYLSCSQPAGEPTNRDHLLHHPRHTQVIERRCKELGIPVTAVYDGGQNKSAKTEGSVVEFLLRQVGSPAAAGK